MVRVILVTVFLNSIVAFYAQTPYDLTGNFRTVKKEMLQNINSLNDIIPNYPVAWISSYKTVEIKTVNNGLGKVSAGLNNLLTSEQKNNLRSADLMSTILITVNYIYKNKITGVAEHQTMTVSLYISPEFNATFDGGEKQLRTFLKQQILGNVNDTIPRRLGMVIVKFTVDETGAIINSKVVKSCGDTFTDMRLLQAINNMPLWKSAEHKGEKIRQEIQFSFGGC